MERRRDVYGTAKRFRCQGKGGHSLPLEEELRVEKTTTQWYKNFDSLMVNQCYKRTEVDPCVCTWRYSYGKFIIFL